MFSSMDGGNWKHFDFRIALPEKRSQLTEENMKEPLKDIRRALLQADVSLPVVRRVVRRIEEGSLGTKVTRGVTPDQQLVQVVANELLNMMGPEASPLELPSPGEGSPNDPAVVALIGLQGSGKTTAAAKLGCKLRKDGHEPLLGACDVYRPAAVEQLERLGAEAGLPVYHEEGLGPVELSKRAKEEASRRGCDVVILDTAGRLQIDSELMEELQKIRHEVPLAENLLVVDATTGQEASNLAREFDEQVGISGSVLTKVDSDARGGAALSVKEVSGKPVKLSSSGEKVEALEPFYPDRLVNRILGMGDVVSLVEKAQESVKAEEAERIKNRVMEAKFDFNDYLEQIEASTRMGPMSSLVRMMPGMAKLSDEQVEQMDREVVATRSMIQSMTPKERENPELLAREQTRRIRVARGSGRTVQQVADLLETFGMMRSRMKALSKMSQAGAEQVGMMPELSDEELMENAKLAISKRVGPGRVKRRRPLARERHGDGVKDDDD